MSFSLPLFFLSCVGMCLRLAVHARICPFGGGSSLCFRLFSPSFGWQSFFFFSCVVCASVLLPIYDRLLVPVSCTLLLPLPSVCLILNLGFVFFLFLCYFINSFVDSYIDPFSANLLVSLRLFVVCSSVTLSLYGYI